VELHELAAAHDTEVVLLGHGSYSDGQQFLKHFPSILASGSTASSGHRLVISTDYKVFPALKLHRAASGLAGLGDFLGPAAIASAVPNALRSLMRPGVLAAKMEQPLPGAGDFHQMRGLLLIEKHEDSAAGARCTFAHKEQTPGANLSVSQICEALGWSA